MAKASPAFTNFTAGQLSDRLDGRTDIAKYANGCKKLQNFLVHAHGGATRRPGTEFIAEVKSSANATRLIPFEFNVEQTYILEFGNQYFRIYRDGGQVVAADLPWRQQHHIHQRSWQLKFTQSADVMYIVHPDHAVRKISRTGHTAWTITRLTFAVVLCSIRTPQQQHLQLVVVRAASPSQRQRIHLHQQMLVD